jgi:hypothetical protein
MTESLSERTMDEISRIAAPLLAKLGMLLLYLVSEKPDISSNVEHADLRAKVIANERRGIRNFQARQIRKWDVGHRIGANLRAYEAKIRESGDATGTGLSKRPHVRHAHWHHYWTGAHDRPLERKKLARWLPPIPVNVNDSDDLVPTKRNVDRKKRKRRDEKRRDK